ncbi:MAG: hypothetical protein ACLU84_03915 [Clostridia bacterium]
MENTQNQITEMILQTINTLFSTLFSSIDNQIYSILDKLTFISPDVLHDAYFSQILGNQTMQNLILIANSLLLAIFLYYAIRLLFSHFSYIEIERPYQFIFKLLFFALCINGSYFICEQILSINHLLSSAITDVGKILFQKEISFNQFILTLNSIISIEKDTFNIFSIDGLIKGFISIGLFNLVFSFSLRYIMVKVFTFLSPFAFLTLINHSTSWLFKTWIRSFLSLLLLQSFISIILLVIFSVSYQTQDLFSKFILIGGIYALSKSNQYMRDLLGGISTDISQNFTNLRTFFK